MDLYLMQHGVATPEDENPARPLTPAGREAVERVAARARALGIEVERCVHSGKLRAEQTAAILASAVGAALEERAGLGPSDPVGPVAESLRREAEATPEVALAVVGHLPFLDRLVSLLVAGDEHAQVVRFRNAGLVKLVPKTDANGFSVAWILVPEATG